MKPQNKSAYRPPAAAVPPPAEAARRPSTWQPDPWLARSEEFYQSIYGTGKCKFCGHPILSCKDMCDCDSMKTAREAFKRKIQPKIQPKSAASPAAPDNPDKYIEPASREPEPETYPEPEIEPEQGTFL